MARAPLLRSRTSWPPRDSAADSPRGHGHLPRRLYRAVAAGEITVEQLAGADWARIAELTQQYGDHPLGGFDASLVAIAERLCIDTIATLDQRHFRAVRPKHVDAFTVVP